MLNTHVEQTHECVARPVFGAIVMNRCVEFLGCDCTWWIPVGCNVSGANPYGTPIDGG